MFNQDSLIEDEPVEELGFNVSNLIFALKKCGWSDERINNLVLYLEDGENEELLDKILSGGV